MKLFKIDNAHPAPTDKNSLKDKVLEFYDRAHGLMFDTLYVIAQDSIIALLAAAEKGYLKIESCPKIIDITEKALQFEEACGGTFIRNVLQTSTAPIMLHELIYEPNRKTKKNNKAA